MSLLSNSLLLGAPAGATTYQVSRSLRFNRADSAHLSKASTSITTFTLSFWMKRCGSARDDIFVTNSSTGFYFYVHTDGSIRVNDNTANRFISNGLYRDPSAWYHIVINNNGSTFNLYVNGVLDKSTSVSLGLYSGTAYICRDGSSGYADVYLAEIHFIDGQALTPSSFAETDSTTGQWIPRLYSGSYGTNGFKLTFADNSAATAAALGKDAAGSNNWTPNNFSVTAGAGNDSLVDTPTSYGTGNSGGDVRGNFCTLNPLDNGGYTLANGNLDVSTTSASWKTVKSTIGVSSGKWYWEFSSTDAALGGSPYRAVDLGIAKSAATLGNYVGSDANGWCYQNYDGSKFNNGSGSSYGATWIAGDVIGVALDADNGTLVFYKNGVSQGTAFTGLTSGPYFPAVSLYTGSSVSGSFNFGQRAFAYTAPSGFKALVDTNLTAPVVAKPNTVMDVLLYTGNGTNGQAITGLNFSPEFVWIKKRSAAAGHGLWDVIRGASNTLSTVNTQTEAVNSVYGKLQSFDGNGFTVTAGTDPSDPRDIVNVNGATYVAWCWDAGTSTVTNTQGSITSSVRANASAGFSIVTWTGTGSLATIGHGLGVAPSFIVIKRRNAATDWDSYHASLGNTQGIALNSTAAASTGSGYWNNTSPTSTVFTVNTGVQANGGTYVAYCFAPVAGYSSFGSYTGNGSADGPFVFTGFRPSYLLIKQSSSSGNNWEVRDYAREPYNDSNRTVLFPSSSLAELTDAFPIDFLSNGFKVRNTGSGSNESGATYIYAAFAESPFQFSRAR